MDITEKAYEAIMTVHPDTRAINIKGQQIALSLIGKVLSREEYDKQYPQKQTPQRATHNAAKSLDEIVADFQWAAEAFQFPELPKLVYTAYSQIKQLGTVTEFEDYCKQHQALTPTGAVVPSVFTDKDGRKHTTVFAYSLFLAIWRYVLSTRGLQEYAEERSWEEIMQGEFPGYDEAKKLRARTGIMRGLEQYIAKASAAGVETPKAEATLRQMQQQTAQRVPAAKPTKSFTDFLQQTGMTNGAEAWQAFKATW